MTGFEPLIAAATAGLTSLVTDIIKGQGSNVFTRLLNQDIGKGMHQAYFNASKKYIQNYAERHGSLKVLGMREPVSLESIYTTVQVLDPEDCSFASVEDLEKSFRKARVRGFWFGKKSKQDGLAIANEKQYLMVLGAPGCGKSTFLRKLGLEALRGSRGGFKKHRCVPILLELKRFAEPKVDFKKLIATEFQVCGFPNAERFTQKALEQGKLLILLDGLDEVPAVNRNAVIEAIQDFVDQYDKNRYITSCRTAAYRHNFRRFTDVTIAEFDDNQIYQFISNWFQSETDKQSGTAKRCWTILQQSENAAAKELAHTPLLLTFLCLVYDRSQTFSNNRSTLYRKALRILLEEWAAEKRINHEEIYQGLNTELEEVLLSEIASKGFDADRLFLSQIELVDQIKAFLSTNLNAPKHLSGETVLNAIAVQQGILVERAEDVYSFSHLTLQEYLTARYIVDHHRIEQLVLQHLSDRRWQEVFLLVSGSMVIGNGADEFLQIMSQAIKTYAVESPKLQAWLQWANQIVTPSADTQQHVAKRAAVIRFATLDPKYGRSLNFDHDPARDPARDLICDLAHGLDRAFGRFLHLRLPLDRILPHDIASSLDPTFDSSRKPFAYIIPPQEVQSLVHSLDLALDRVRQLAASPLFLFLKVDLSALLEQLELLRSSVPPTTAQHAQRKQFTERLLALYYGAFQLNPTSLKMSELEKDGITTYFYMNRLMVKCKQEASRVSPQVWESILATMFAPADTTSN